MAVSAGLSALLVAAIRAPKVQAGARAAALPVNDYCFLYFADFPAGLAR